MELPAVRRTQPIIIGQKFSLTIHAHLLQWLHGKQQQLSMHNAGFRPTTVCPESSDPT